MDTIARGMPLILATLSYGNVQNHLNQALSSILPQYYRAVIANVRDGSAWQTTTIIFNTEHDADRLLETLCELSPKAFCPKPI